MYSLYNSGIINREDPDSGIIWLLETLCIWEKVNMNSQVKLFRTKTKEGVSGQNMLITDWLLGTYIHGSFTFLSGWRSFEGAAALTHWLNKISPESHSHDRAQSLRNTGDSTQRSWGVPRKSLDLLRFVTAEQLWVLSQNISFACLKRTLVSFPG